MNTEKFIELAKQKVAKYANNFLLENGESETIYPTDVYITWFSKTVQNYKALLGVPIDGDGHYYEVTYNGDLKEMYLDVYDLQDQDTYELYDHHKHQLKLDSDSVKFSGDTFIPNSAVRENVKYMTDKNSTNGLHFYYVMSPIGIVREVCVAHNKHEAINLVEDKLSSIGAWGDPNPNSELQAYLLKPDRFERPKVINTGL